LIGTFGLWTVVVGVRSSLIVVGDAPGIDGGWELSSNTTVVGDASGIDRGWEHSSNTTVDLGKDASMWSHRRMAVFALVGVGFDGSGGNIGDSTKKRSSS
jgi:hypothetical protein